MAVGAGELDLPTSTPFPFSLQPIPACYTSRMKFSAIRNALGAHTFSNGFESDDDLILQRKLERRFELLTILCQAQWELLRERTGLTDEDLSAKIAEVDARDGLLDGKMTPAIVNCTSCARPGSTRREVCLYCGSALPKEQSSSV
jgi:hypothetical protein